MKLKIPFYQTTWSGISLVDLAKKLEHPLEKLPDARFYDAYYKKISNRKSLLNKKWKLSKKKITQWLKEQIDMHGNCKSHIISIGAGTGIIEIPLIESGYTIDLQEYQEESLDIFQVRNLTTCYVKDLKTIEGINYDIAVVIAMTYALSDKELELFFESCAKILGKNGKLIILDTSLSWWEIYAYCRNKSY